MLPERAAGAVGAEHQVQVLGALAGGAVCIADGTLVHAWAGAGLAKIPPSMRTFG